MCLASKARLWLGKRMYRWYALLLHLPRPLITESCIPAAAADVAAPIVGYDQKICSDPALCFVVILGVWQ